MIELLIKNNECAFPKNIIRKADNMKKSLVVLFTLCCASMFAQEKGQTINFKDLPDFKLIAHVNEKPAALPEGTSARKNDSGIEITYNFTSPRHDAVMIEFPTMISYADSVTVDLTVEKPGHRPFIVVTDANGECHYFSLIPTSLIADQVIKKSGRQTLNAPLLLKNQFPGERFAYRWGGDNNQKIDFPIKRVMLGLNDYPDTFTGKGKIIFHTLKFNVKGSEK